MSAGDAGELHEALLRAEEAVAAARARSLDVDVRLDAVRTTLSMLRELLAVTEGEQARRAAELRDALQVQLSRTEAWTAQLLVEARAARDAAA